MNDDTAAWLLRSENPLVLIEASAGCGKTFQGAEYAKAIAPTLGTGRLLILTHTHAACGVFSDQTKGVGARVEVRTIDALVVQIATAYHKCLALPADLSVWAWQDGGKGFAILAEKVAKFLSRNPMVCRALACRYPVVVCDEHQDSSANQHETVMALHRAGAHLRIFGDRMQRIYGGNARKIIEADLARWDALSKDAAIGKLIHPHRWKKKGCPELGEWILKARECLEQQKTIDLTEPVPRSLTILKADNLSSIRTVFQLAPDQGRLIRKQVDAVDQMMILASHNDFVQALRAFWGRTIPIWEGHTREALATLVSVANRHVGDAPALTEALIDFVSSVSIGFGRSSHSDRLLAEVRAGCVRPASGKPAHIQAIGRQILAQPNHIGLSQALSVLNDLIHRKEPGFAEIKVDHRVEFREAIRLAQFSDPATGFAEIARKRAHIAPSPPPRVLSSVHKAKGLECDNVLVFCDKSQFPDSYSARCRLYVALSRAKRSLAIAVSSQNPSPLFKI
jgi:AAA domain/UvrD-like helicase C-terminal domain